MLLEIGESLVCLGKFKVDRPGLYQPGWRLAKRLTPRVVRSLSVVSRGGGLQKPQLWLFHGGFLFTGLGWDPRGPPPGPSAVSPPFCPLKSLQLRVWPWKPGPGGRVVGFRAGCAASDRALHLSGPRFLHG